MGPGPEHVRTGLETEQPPERLAGTDQLAALLGHSGAPSPGGAAKVFPVSKLRQVRGSRAGLGDPGGDSWPACRLYLSPSPLPAPGC